MTELKKTPIVTNHTASVLLIDRFISVTFFPLLDLK